MTPSEIAAHYNFPDGDGAGHHLAIIELNGGYHADDMSAALGGLHPAPTITDFSITSRHEGLPITGHNSPLAVDRIGAILDAFDAGASISQVADQFGAYAEWSAFLATFETTLDLQIAGSLVNAASLDVYFAPRSTDGLRSALTEAVDAAPTVISISWGLSEFAWEATEEGRRAFAAIDAELARARSAGITVCCASGDHGSTNEPPGGPGIARVNFPASSAHALAVGGTSFAGGADVVWNTEVFGQSRASGGGASGIIPRPDHQATLELEGELDVWRAPGLPTGFRGRLVPDVAALADREPGYSIVLGGRPFTADGTSAATPLWAALLVRISQRSGAPVGWVNDRLYAGAGRGFTDVVAGDNRVPGAHTWFSAGPGWDACTGWGAPDGAEIERLLLD